jgi:hypothetical protein
MPDFQFLSHGSICILTPKTEQAKEWVAIHLPEDAMRWAGGYAIEPRYADSILEGIASDGLTLQ